MKSHAQKGVPMGTIVNSMNTQKERMAELADYELNEFVTTFPR